MASLRPAEDMVEKDPGRERRLQILSEVSSLLNEDSDNSSEVTLPFSPQLEDQLEDQL